MPIARLDRAIITLTGENVFSWLDGLVTNSLDGDINFAALLTPQGKIIADFFVWRTDDGAMIETPRSTAAAFLTKLKMYRLRAAITIKDVSDQWDVLALWDGAGKEGLGDPRDLRLGRRLIAPAGKLSPSHQAEDYDRHRLALGMVDSQWDFGGSDLFPANANMDLLNGIDFHKGCFIGQEVASRMHRKSDIRKRLRGFSYEGEISETTLECAERNVGEIRHARSGHGMALVRDDRLKKGEIISAGDAKITLFERTEIRRNDPSVLRPFAEMNIKWIRDLHNVEDSDQRMYDHPENYMQPPNSIFSVHVDGEVAGVCALKQDKLGEYELTKMAVDETFQGRGLGQLLMDAVESYAKETLGLQSIYLLSNTKNAAAIRLYKRAGWTVNHEGPHPQYARCNIGMVKQL